MNKVLSKKVEDHPKTSAAESLLMKLEGRECTLQFERQDEAFSGVLVDSLYSRASWICGASFKSHWLTAIELNDDATYTICVRIPDDEYGEMVADFVEEQNE